MTAFKNIGFLFEHSYTALPKTLFSDVNPSMVPKPEMVLYNEKLSDELGLNIDSPEAKSLITSFLSGNSIHPDSRPIAMAYAGHQFGHFNILGDGRAILLGEHITPEQKRFDIQLKGSGKTIYSRNGDGKATLKAMLREYLISEAMHHYKIPTSRSLAVISTGENIRREEINPGAVLTRIAASHIRVGTFEYIRQYESPENLTLFTDYVIERHYPELINTENPALALLEAVMKKQIALTVNWMRVGFIHGVMNTDNTSIAGETIDYGPCAFINTYNLNTVYSSIDQKGRYAFGNQPNIIHWNMTRFAEALLPLIDEDIDKAVQKGTEVLMRFSELYNEAYTSMLCRKIGLTTHKKEDLELVEELLNWMQEAGADYTNTFLFLEGHEIPQSGLYANDVFLQWKETWLARIREASNWQDAVRLMQENNPMVIPRNNMVENALENAVRNNDYTLFNGLLNQITSENRSSANRLEYMISPSADFEQNYYTYCGT